MLQVFHRNIVIRSQFVIGRENNYHRILQNGYEIYFIIALVAAALTTAVGAVSSTSGIWEEILLEKNEKFFTYRNFRIASCALSCVVSFADLDTIVRVIGPVLDACYPAAIVIAMYYCLCRKPDDPVKLMAGKWAVIIAFVISILQLAVRYSEMFGLGWDMLSRIYYALPLAGYSLAWLPVCVILYAVMIAVSRLHLSHQKIHDRELCV